MIRDNKYLWQKIDWKLILIYLALCFIGIANIYASVYDENSTSIFSRSMLSSWQITWFAVAIVVALLILFILPPKLYFSFAWWLYFFTIILLLAVLVLGKEVNGSKSWMRLGPVSFQPSEISKISSYICLSVVMGKFYFNINKFKHLATALITVLIPCMLIALEPEIGTLLVYCGLMFVFYREGISGWYIIFGLLMILLFVLTLKFSPYISILVAIGIFGTIISIYSYDKLRKLVYTIASLTLGIGLFYLFDLKIISENIPLSKDIMLVIVLSPVFLLFIWKWLIQKYNKFSILLISLIVSIMFTFSVQAIFDNILKDHHRARIENLLGITQDLQGAGYNVNQSKIAIGSGGFLGKGFLNGTQTKFDFVPEQSTDFIFCTIGEEWGFVGSLVVLGLFFALITRIIILSDKQKDRTYRIYGYCIASCITMHVLINIGMTIGLMPVIGIPLPFISYGGSSLVSFTTLLFIFIRLDMERWNH